MKFSLATIALAATAIAAPTNPTTSDGNCNIRGDNNGKTVCCNSAIPVLGQLLCNIALVGGSCNTGQTTYCCKTDATGGIINVSLLNCVNV